MLPPGYGQRMLGDGPRRTNRRVVAAWARGLPAHSGSLSTDGDSLYSYRLRIGYTDARGHKIAVRYQGRHGYSHTTSLHVGLATVVADRVMDPAGA